MKKVVTAILLSVMFNYAAKSQEWVDVNIIVTVNETLSPNSAIVKLGYDLTDGTSKDIEVKYSPGSLKIKSIEYEKLLKDSVQYLRLEIRNMKTCNNNISYSHFKIDDFKKIWLKQDFFILNIYDTDIKKYKSIYDALPNKNFTYDYDSPSGSMRRVQKKKIKTDCLD